MPDHSLRRRLVRGLERLQPRELLAGDAPLALDDVFIAKEGTVVIIDVLRNDRDAENDPLTITAVTNGSSGNVINNGGNTITYSPNTGFLGSDTFRYTISDGTSQSTASVRVTINQMFDGEAARDAILAGVTTLADPAQPGHMVTFGQTALSIANYPGADSSQPAIAAASMGSGRVIAMGDHQYLNMDNYGGTASMQAFYTGGIEWLSESTNKSIKIVTHRVSASTWLTSQGYTNVVDASTASLSTDLVGADVLIAWMGNNPSQANMVTVDQYTKDGGGLFLVDYGIGYQWWWNRATPDIPGNQLLRDAGIGFVKDWPRGGTQAIERATTQITSDDVIAALQDSSGLTPAAKDEIAQVYRKLNEVLGEDDLLQARLDAEFSTRINSINPTPATPVSDSFEQVLLRREMDLIANLAPSQIVAHRTVADVYGDVPAEAPRTVDAAVTVATDHSGFLPTGMYAPAGEVVTVVLPAALAGKGYEIRISGHRDNISSRSSWYRVPYGVSPVFPVDSTTVQIASSFGGAIYLDVGGQAAGVVPNLGDQQLTFTGSVEAPYFVLGETTDADWINSIRDNPAPFAEFVSPNLSFSLPSNQIRNLDNPTELMTLWNDVVAFQDWVGGFETTRTGPDRFNIDVQISVGYLHAGYPIQGPTSTGPGIVNHTAITSRGNWGYFHELGHEMQRHPELGWGYNNPWTFNGDTEVTVNIFAAAALELAAPDTGTSGWGYSAHADATMAKAVTTVSDASKPNFDQKDPYPFYFQLADGPWGWQAYRDVLSTYVDQQLHDPGALPNGNTDEKDQWLIRWSRATGRDMTEYMVDQWGLEVTQAAKDTVAAMNLPGWMPLAMQSSAQSFDLIPGSSTTINFAAAGHGLDNVSTLVSVGIPTVGSLTDLGNGVFSYSADLFETGLDTFEVTYQSSAGNQQTFTVEIDVNTRGVLMERFDGIGGSTITDLTGAASYPGSPDTTTVMQSFEIPTNTADSYGVRLRGYVTPPASGDYTFWIASDDEGQLLLSDSEDPSAAALIANVPGWSSSRQWDKFSQQQSQVISLVAGKPYYIEALMKEGGGGDNLAVAWAGPGISQPATSSPTVIDGQFLTPFGIAPIAPQVESVIVNAGQTDRSQLSGLQVVFDDSVQFKSGSSEPFSINRVSDGQSISFDRIVSLVNGKTVVDLSFDSAALPDGNYQLVVDSSLVGMPGKTLDGDADGFAGGDHEFGDTEVDAFFRLFGDSDGDRDVDAQDYGRFALTFMRNSSDAGFDARFDFDADGDVDGQDYGKFSQRFLRTLPY